MKSLSLSQPHVIVMVGVPGSGKSFFATKFAETFHAPYISRDRIQALTHDVDLADALTLLELDQFLKTRHTLLFEGPTMSRAERADIARRAHRAGYEALFVWVQTDPATARARSTRPSKDSHYQTIDDAEYDRRLRRFAAPQAGEKTVVISGKHTYATQVRVVLKKLSHPRGATAIAGHSRPPIRPTTPPQSSDGRRNIMIQ